MRRDSRTAARSAAALAILAAVLCVLVWLAVSGGERVDVESTSPPPPSTALPSATESPTQLESPETHRIALEKKPPVRETLQGTREAERTSEAREPQAAVTANISGVVVDATTDKPIEGALVRAAGVFSREVWSDREGRFELRGVHQDGFAMSVHGPAHRFILEAEKAGYVFPQNARFISSSLPPSSDTQEVTGVRLRLVPATARLSGTVHWPDGRPADRRFDVRVFDEKDNEYRTSLDDSGRFEFTALPEGPALVAVTPRQRSPELLGVARAKTVLVAGEEQVLGLDIAAADYTVEGVVSNVNGTPFENAVLRLTVRTRIGADGGGDVVFQLP